MSSLPLQPDLAAFRELARKLATYRAAGSGIDFGALDHPLGRLAREFQCAWEGNRHSSAGSTSTPVYNRGAPIA